jgi:hypothetical protein
VSIERWLNAWDTSPRVIQIQHGRLEGLQWYIAPHRAPPRRVRRLARILRKRAIRKHSPHIFKAGQKQPPEFRIQVEGIFGPQPVKAIVRMLTEHRVERRELEVGQKRLFI